MTNTFSEDVIKAVKENDHIALERLLCSLDDSKYDDYSNNMMEIAKKHNNVEAQRIIVKNAIGYRDDLVGNWLGDAIFKREVETIKAITEILVENNMEESLRSNVQLALILSDLNNINQLSVSKTIVQVAIDMDREDLVTSWMQDALTQNNLKALTVLKDILDESGRNGLTETFVRNARNSIQQQDSLLQAFEANLGTKTSPEDKQSRQLTCG